MKTVRVIVGGVAVYAAVLLFFIHVLHVPAKSDLYWLPFFASLAAVVCFGIWGPGQLRLKLVGVVVCAAVVLAVDLVGVVWYSCARGVCS
jgi:hypothetical protein